MARQRTGVIALEFLLSMPVLFITTLAAFQFGILALVVLTGTTAVMEAAREGAKTFSDRKSTR
ncbi:MAG: TadE family protein, partial [Planctomycetaceae bacterium]